jgi:Predicted integral membrane protein
MIDHLKRWYPVVLVIVSAAASLAVFDRLPEQIAVHWDLAGNPNGWMPRAVGAFATPALLLFAWAMLRVAPTIDPRRENYDRFGAAYDIVVAALLIPVFLLHFVLLAIALGYPVPMARLAPALLGAMFVVIGNVMPRARSNFMFGIRTPWTLSNDRVWARTHHLAGYTMTVAGLVMLVAAALAPAGALQVIIISAIAAALLAPAVYSYLTFRRETIT